MGQLCLIRQRNAPQNLAAAGLTQAQWMWALELIQVQMALRLAFDFDLPV